MHNRMSQPNEARAHIALLVDYQNLKLHLASHAASNGSSSNGSSANGAGSNGSNGEHDANGAEGSADAQGPGTREVADAVMGYAESLGRVGIARAYADWSRYPKGARALGGTGLHPVLVPATESGDDRSHIRLAVEAVDILHGRDEPEAFVIASNDPTLVPLVESLRAAGSIVHMVGGEGEGAEELREDADTFVALEAVLGGARGLPIPPRQARARTSDRGGHGGGQGRGWRDNEGRGHDGRGHGGRRDDRGGRHDDRARSYQGPMVTSPDFDDYDWTAFVQLIHDLEERLPFVGVRYLVNKVLAPHNCGVSDPRIKRDLINEAVEEGIIEMYSVGNVDERTDPVTACRLDREHDIVLDVLELDDEADDDDDFEPLGEDVDHLESAR